MRDGPELTATLRALEEVLIYPLYRLTRREMAIIVADDFIGVGGSGSIYGKAQTLRTKSLGRHGETLETSIENFHARALNDRIALVTYRAVRRKDRRHQSLRSSVWAFTDDRWQLKYHQRTPIATQATANGHSASPTEFVQTAPQPSYGQRKARSRSRPTVTVGLFVAESLGADRSSLVEGFRRDLIACLVRFREWSVLEADPERAPDVVGASDGSARYQIAGAALRSGEAIHLSLTVRDLGTNAYVWSDRIELPLQRWLEAQLPLVRRLAMTLNLRLASERLATLAAEPDRSLPVYDKWLRGQAMISRFGPDDWRRAERLFEDAAQEAPDHPLGLSGLVEMSNTTHIAHPGTLRDPARAASTLDMARRAVAIDPAHSRTQLCLGWSYAMNQQFTQAAAHMELALELNANESWTLMSTALFYAFCGDTDRAHDMAGQSLKMSLTPSPAHWAYQVSILFLCEDYAGAVDAADRAGDAIRTLPAWRAASLFHLGRRDEAALEAGRFLTGIRESWFGHGPADDQAIAGWLLHLYPIQHQPAWGRLRAGVVGAGIPGAGSRHDAW